MSKYEEALAAKADADEAVVVAVEYARQMSLAVRKCKTIESLDENLIEELEDE